MEKSLQGKGAPHYMGVFMENRGIPQRKEEHTEKLCWEVPQGFRAQQTCPGHFNFGAAVAAGGIFQGIEIQVKGL